MFNCGGGADSLVEEGADNDFLMSCKGASFISSLASYVDRGAGGTAWYSADFSMLLHGKYSIQEDDIRTHLSEGSSLKNASESVGVIRRCFAHALCLGAQGLWHVDFTSDWFDDPLLLGELRRQVEIGKTAVNLRHESVAETLLVSSNRVWRYRSPVFREVSDSSDKIVSRKTERNFNYYSHQDNYHAMVRAGIPLDIVVDDDLFNKACERYKLYIFPVEFFADSKMRARIRELTGRPGVSSIFFYAPGFVDESSACPENIAKLTSFKAAFENRLAWMSAEINDKSEPLFNGVKSKTIGVPDTEACRFYIDDPDARALASFPDGKTAVASKRLDGGVTVYSAVPISDPVFYRNLARLAGVHIYSELNDNLMADNNFVAVHANKSGKRVISLPKPASSVTDVFTGKKIPVSGSSFSMDMRHGDTRVIYTGDNASLFQGGN
jgi:hypothetical protein